MIIDTHAHVNFKDFEPDFQAVIDRANKKNIVMINAGTQIRTSRRAVELAQNNNKTFAAVGLHPIQLHEREIVEEGTQFKSRAEDFDWAAFEQLARLDEVVAIGECGLDYYHLEATDDIVEIKQKQKKVLHEQIELANQENLPMMIHCRGSRIREFDALKDVLAELKIDLPKRRGVLHSFAGDWDLAQQFLELGFYLGFNGIITFDKTGRTSEIIANMPSDRLLVETDCPYLTPAPYRGERNEPAYVEYVVQKVAEIRRISVDQASQTTTNNAKSLFSLSI